MKFYQSLTWAVIMAVLLQACGSTALPVMTPTENIREQFSPIPAPNADGGVAEEPLVAVEIPPRSVTPDDNAYIVRLVLGQPAPFTGILFSDSASAYITTEYQALAERFQLTLSRQRDTDAARLMTNSESWRLRMNADRERFIIVLENQQQQILDLRQINEASNSQWPKIWIGVGAAGIGILVGLVVGFFAGR